MPIILVTNDDGVDSPGITALYEAMKSLGDAVIAAPDRERSAAGHSLTIHRPLKAENINGSVWRINGTPTDCVVIGVEKILGRRPDLIVSGINRGPNLGDDITYSGTVSAAMEGTIMGVPSIAFSLDYPGKGDAFYESASDYAKRIAEYALENSLPYDTLLNVNVPNLPLSDVKGMKITRQGKRVYEGAVHDIRSPFGAMHYWIGGGKAFYEHGEDTDMNALLEGYVSITPVHMDLTNYDAIKFLREKWGL